MKAPKGDNMRKLLLLITIIFLLTISCTQKNDQPKIKLPSLEDIPASAWQQLSAKKIFFGHQSVGANIIDGIKDIIREHPYIKLNIVTVPPKESYHFTHPAFLHKRIGRNMDPESKIDDFADNIEHKLIVKPDIAILKFCYVDFNPTTDINKVFDYYINTISQLQKRFPEITFVHVTVPLTCYAPGLDGLVKGLKDVIKQIIGKTNLYDFSCSNIYNRKLIAMFKGKQPVFDLALIESTREDGTRVYYLKNGTIYYELAKEYTNDGGHLNKIGRRKVAEQLLIFLAKMASE